MNLAFIGLILFLTFVFFEPSIFFPILGEIRAAFIISMLTLLVALISGARPPKAIQNRLLILLLLVAITTLLLSPLSFSEINQNHLSHLYKAIALYFLVSMIIASENNLLKFIYVTLGLGFVVSFITLFTGRAGILGLKGGNLYRMVNYFGGIGDDPNEFGAVMLILFPLPMCMIQNENSLIRKIVWGISGLIYLLCIIRTRSRGAFLGLIIILIFLIWEHRQKAMTISLLLLMLVYAYFNTHYGYWERVLSLRSTETIESDYAAHSRVLQDKYSIDLIKLHPLTGVGIGNFMSAKVKMLGLDPVSKDTMMVSHNSYLGLAAETGLIGLLLYILIILYSFRCFFYAEYNFKTKPDTIIYCNITKGLRIGFIGFLVSIFFLSEQYNLIFYQWIALAVVLSSLAEKKTMRIANVIGKI